MVAMTVEVMEMVVIVVEEVITVEVVAMAEVIQEVVSLIGACVEIAR